MENFGDLVCHVKIENVKNSGKPVAYNQTLLQLGRDQTARLVLKIHKQSYYLKDFKILQKFAAEGKATLMFPKLGFNVMLSNAPPDQLIAFLKILRIKTKIDSGPDRGKVQQQMRTRDCFNEISPLTVQDVVQYKKIACIQSPNISSKKVTETTPILLNKKRKKPGEENNGPRKRLNSLPLIALGKTPPERASSEFKKLVNSGHDEKKRLNLFAKLTGEQTTVFEAVKSGLNVFFTGGAGTGKSYLLKKIIGVLPPDSTVASASTGVAACHIGGTTIHSFAGIGSGDASLERCVELASRNSVAQNWRQCKVLIIDEISMLDSVLFDKLEKVARAVRRNDRPFGGIQLVLCGDFLQLPPVQKEHEDKRFCFQAKSWSSCIQVSYELTEVKRQSDKEFVGLLRYIRLGKCPDHVYEKLMRTQKNAIETQGITATRLCTHKDNAHEINQTRIQEIKGEEKAYRAKDSSLEYVEQMNKYLPVDKRLVLKVGAQVMLTKNLDVSGGLVNGARGVVTKFCQDKGGLPQVKFSTRKEIIIKPEKFIFKTTTGHVTRTQIPLRLAWAISIHKSQGLTLDCCEVSLSRVFECGQAYVALSRAKSLEGLRVLDINRSAIKANREVLKFYIQLRRELRMRGEKEPQDKQSDINFYV